MKEEFLSCFLIRLKAPIFGAFSVLDNILYLIGAVILKNIDEFPSYERGIHEGYMHRAIELAKKGEGRVSPNPIVGAVIVENRRIIGEGYHEYYGGLHAERNAVLKCEEDIAGADLYVTLEPCCHYGKTPPCTDIIIERGIKRVFVGAVDDNPIVFSKGIKILRDSGIEVITGVLEKQCHELNYIFFHYIKTGLPLFAMKYAMSADGKIASYTGNSKWITSEDARKHVHYLRNKFSAIMVGIGTVIKDDPMLNCRISGGNDPTRIICDSHMKIPLNSKIIKTADKIKTIIAVSENYTSDKKNLLERAGIEVIVCGENHVDMVKLKDELGKRKIDSVLIEGGGEINYSVVESNTADRAFVYIGSKVIGGKDAKTPVGGRGVENVSDAYNLKLIGTENFGDDILLKYDFVR